MYTFLVRVQRPGLSWRGDPVIALPVETCPRSVISWAEIHGRLPEGPDKPCRSARNRYLRTLNPNRPRYICQACPEKTPLVQMLSLLCLHQKI